MKDINKTKRSKRQQRAKRIRSKIFGSAKKPRLAIFRSNKHIYAQLIDDSKGKTLASVSDLELKGGKKKGRMELAGQVGQAIAQKALAINATEAIFDKRGYKYHGVVKSLAEGARSAGLKL